MRGSRSRVAWTIVAVSALSIVTFAASAGPAPADGPDTNTPASANEWTAPQAGPHARPSDGIFGVIPASSDSTSGWHRPSASDFARTSFAVAAPLTYHGGPVMTTNTTYAIYWMPSGSTVSANYAPLVNQYLGDVAAASGSSTNVYATDTQYYQGTTTKTPVAYKSTFVAGTNTATDSTTPIPNHCASQYTSLGLKVSGCITDADIQAEIASVMSTKGWTASPTSLFFLFTPPNVGSCVTSTSSTCSYTYYCAYHSDFQKIGSGDVIYANQPYPDSTGVGAPGACDSGQKPNGDWADQTINLISHEHNESITDPNGNAWYDSSGNENGDKCAWNFGTTLGSNTNGQYNQVINGHDYYVQQEWSNASSNCALGFTPPAPPTVSDFTPTSGQAGASVTITGTGFTGATAVTFNGTGATFIVNGATQISAIVPAGAMSGPISVTGAGVSVASAGSFTVLPTTTPDFTLGATPSSATVTRGRSTSYSVSVTGTGGFTGSVRLRVSGLPNRASASLSPSTVSAGGSSTVTVTTSTRTPAGTYTLTVTGTSTSGSPTHGTTVTLVVQ